MDIPLQSLFLMALIVAVPTLISGVLVYGYIKEGRIMGVSHFPFFQLWTKSFWYSTGMPKYVSRKYEPVEFWFGFIFLMLPLIGIMLLLMLMGICSVLGLTLYELTDWLF